MNFIFLREIFSARWKAFVLVGSFLVLFSACDWINPVEPIPAYLRIEQFQLQTNVPFQGPSNHKISDAWVYVDGKLLGVFEMPFEVPVIATGSSEVVVYGGIKNNGIAASRVVYPFYTAFRTTVDWEELQTITLDPVVQYHDITQISWLETFEDPGISLDTTLLSSVALGDSLVSGNRVGRILLTPGRDSFEAETVDFYEFPADNPTTYIEMDYLANNEFAVGINMRLPETVIIQPLIYIRPNSEWNKIYIDASYYAQSTAEAEDFKIFFRAVRNDTVPKAIILIDNLKLVHF